MVFLKVEIRARSLMCAASSDSRFLPPPTPQLVLAQRRTGASFARCVRGIAAVAAVGVLLSPLWKASVAYKPLYHKPRAYESAATVGAASVGHERTKGESRDQRTRDMRGIAEIAEFADQGAGN